MDCAPSSLMAVSVLTGEHTALAVGSLHKWGCCPRCILRFLGEKQQCVYRQSIAELEEWVNKHQTNVDSAANGAGSSGEQGGTCVTCLGLLQAAYCTSDFQIKIADAINKEKFLFNAFSCPITLPVTQMLREHAIWILLKELIPEVYATVEEGELLTLKDVWRWLNGKPIAQLLRSTFEQQQGDFEVSLFFVHDKLSKECNFLCDLHPDMFRKHKNQREVFTRVRVAQALSSTSDDEFRQCYQSPPLRPDTVCSCSLISCRHSPVYVAGRYNKYSRHLSQTPWFVDGGRKTESSIEELVCTKIVDLVQATGYRFSSSGREDVDVKMLGTGRPFVIELTNPHNAGITQAQLGVIETEINAATQEIAVRHVQLVTRDDTTILKEGETTKKKSYCALCWAQKELKQADVDVLCQNENLVIAQKTPLRVLHRRPLAVRERVVHTMCAQLIDSHHFQLRMSTQAGTYIKEFVHGDFGRTTPNLGDLLNTYCDILELDVENVELDWPKQLSYS